MKLCTVVGARPQFIKAAAVNRALKSANYPIDHVLIQTGQHYDMNLSDIFFDEMGIPAPDYHLGIHDAPHGAMTGRMLEKIEEILLKEKPDCCLVYGDTNSTLAGALAAAKQHIFAAHVEAGLRSHNRRMPEEINRIVADHCSDLLFTPTRAATEQLIKEGIPQSKIRQVGDVMFDLSLHLKMQALATSHILDTLSLTPKDYLLATIHRAENTDDSHRLEELFHGLKLLALEVPVVVPLHPRTRKALENLGLLESLGRAIRFIEPVGYLDMVCLENSARIIATDSGGVQKEAFFFRVPSLCLRDETEWTELLEGGYLRLVSADRNAIKTAYDDVLKGHFDWDISPYGDGKAAERILETLRELIP